MQRSQPRTISLHGGIRILIWEPGRKGVGVVGSELDLVGRSVVEWGYLARCVSVVVMYGVWAEKGDYCFTLDLLFCS